VRPAAGFQKPAGQFLGLQAKSPTGGADLARRGKAGMTKQLSKPGGWGSLPAKVHPTAPGPLHAVKVSPKDSLLRAWLAGLCSARVLGFLLGAVFVAPAPLSQAFAAESGFSAYGLGTSAFSAGETVRQQRHADHGNVRILTHSNTASPTSGHERRFRDVGRQAVFTHTVWNYQPCRGAWPYQTGPTAPVQAHPGS
jgi:hypothetical protein